MREILKGSTDQSCIVRVVDSADGTPETGFAYNTAGIDMWYRREGGLRVAITEADLAAVDTAHADGGIKHISDGYVRVDLPDAAVATGANGVLVGGAATGMVVIGCYLPLVNWNPYDGVRAGLTALPNAAADAAGGLVISDAGGLDADVQRADVAAILVDTGTTLDGRLPAALVGGRIDANAGAISGDATAADNLETMLDGTGGQTLSLGKLNVVNSAGDAAVFSSTGSNGHGISASGNGTGEGLRAKGGASGHGLVCEGGATTGNGFVGTALAGNSSGMSLLGVGSGHGLLAQTGTGPGSGIHARGGASGADPILSGGDGISCQGFGWGSGLAAHGGGDSGNGVGPGPGILGACDGTVAGLQCSGGAGSAGLRITSGSGNAGGVVVTSSGTGAAVQLTPGGTGIGLSINAGTDMAAVDLMGNGIGPGFRATGGATGAGMTARGGSTSGPGLNVLAQIEGNAAQFVAAGTAKHGIHATGAALGTSDGIKATAGAAGGVDIRGNLTGNITGAVSGAVGSVTGNVGGNVVGSVALLATDAITAAAVSSAAANKIADQTRRRTQANVEASSDGDALSVGSEYGAIQQMQEAAVSGATMTIFKTDGTTSLGTKTLASDPAADPITGIS